MKGNDMPRAVRIYSYGSNGDLQDAVFDDIGERLRMEVKTVHSQRHVMRFDFENAKDLHAYLSWWLGRERKVRAVSSDE